MDPATLARLALLSAILAVSTPGAPSNVSTAASPTATSISTAGSSETYVVQAGDTLYSIAIKYGTTILALEQANNITNPNALAIGTRLVIPGTVAQNAATPAPTARGPTTPAPTPPNAATPLPNATAVAAAPQVYVVQAGDTLASIGAQFGVSVAELQRANNLSDVNLLNVGQQLVIPSIAPEAALPEGISFDPQVIRQGQTVKLQVKADNVSEVIGKFDQQQLKFNRVGDNWVALVGISRCANYIGSYPVSLTVRDNLGNPKQLQFDVRVNATPFTLNDITLTASMSALLDPAIMNSENSLVAQTVGLYTPGQDWQGLFRMPLDVPNPRVSSFFGERRSYNGGKPGLCGHEGQDFAVPEGTPVYAPAAGVVVLAQKLQVRGNVVFLDHGRGVYSAFYHMVEIDAKDGQQVQPGDLLGKVGTTGFSTGDHLHWSMWVNGIYVDPIQWTKEHIP